MDDKVYMASEENLIQGRKVHPELLGILNIETPALSYLLYYFYE